MTLYHALDELDADRRFSFHITAWQRLEPQLARYGPWPAALDPRLAAACRVRGMAQLYTHQAEAVEAALCGRHVAVVTPTASGKTLCYNLPALQALLTDPAARALYLFPTKALAQDQLAELAIWDEVLAAGLHPATYDGDTPQGARPTIRRQARVVVTNPDMLHTGILPHHTRWPDLFANLRYVVLDEIHAYRGVFGSHVANVVRRLKRVCRWYGSQPQFICCSATIANPRELASRLTEEEVTLVDDDGSPKGERHFLLYNPPLVDRELGVRRSALMETQTLARHFLSYDLQTIVFTVARMTTELLLTYLRRAMEERLPSSEVIRGYRAGYRPDERRTVERGLRDGMVRGVVSTNALELGIDIGGMDVCLMAGYPGTIASTWQQAGRAGRRAGVSAAMLVASGNPLEQYIITHPDYFFGQSPEHGLINPDNLLILLAHLRCAAFELPFEDGEEFGKPSVSAGAERPSTGEFLSFLEEEGVLHRSGAPLRQAQGRAWHWMADAYPAESVSLRTTSLEQVVITDHSTEPPLVIGTVERQRAPLFVHEGAIYLHEGRQYLVEELDWEAGQARVRPVDADYYTGVSYRVDVRPLEVFEQAQVAGATVAHGEVVVKSKATSFRKIRWYTQETLGWGEVDIPEQEMVTTGYWFVLSEATVERLRQAGWWDFDPIGYRGPDWEEQRARARARDGYRCQQCSAPERPDRQHDVHHLKPFRDFGYVPGENEAYLEANRLENLITLCRNCHRRIEITQRFQGALTGLSHVLGHIAPLYLMCSPRDIGIQAEAQAAWNKAPTVTIYEHIPAGVGFSETLFRLHDTLLRTARELITDCPCTSGCPSCVGPSDEVGEDAKAYTLAILKELMPLE